MKDRLEWQFRDQKVPARLCHLLQQGRISATDLLLCFVIDALVRPQGEKTGRGCYANNSFLSRAVNAASNYVSGRIHHLARYGLLLVFWVDGVRYLEMEWSRTAEERQALCGKYGRTCRRAYKELLDKLDSRRDTGKPVAPPTGKPVAPPTGKPEVIYKEENERRRNGRGISPQGFANSNGKDISPRFYQMGDRLRQILRSKRPLVQVGRSSRLRWAEEMQILWRGLGKDEAAVKRIQDMLDWLEGNINKIDRPTIRDAEQYRKHFHWLEDVCRDMAKAEATERKERDRW